MKKVLSICFAVVLLFSFCFPASAALSKKIAESAVDDAIVDVENFFYIFNYVSALLGKKHELSVEKADEFSKLSGKMLLKTIYGNGEILSLILSEDAKEVKEVACTLPAAFLNNSIDVDDFFYLLMESLYACGMSSDSISEIFVSWGQQDKFDIGDSGESVADELKVSYEVTSLSGLSFHIVKYTEKDKKSDETSFDYDEAVAAIERQEELNKGFKSVANNRIREYWEVKIDNFMLTYNDKSESVTITMYLTWNVNNGKDMAKKMLEMYSDDMAATLKEAYPDISISRLCLLWTNPYISKKWTAAKYFYTSYGSKIYRTDALGLLYGKE